MKNGENVWSFTSFIPLNCDPVKNVVLKLSFFREYGDFNLDELCEGDRIGMVRKGETGSLHFFINGLDQGVAATRVPSQIWGVVDLYGMTVKVYRRFPTFCDLFLFYYCLIGNQWAIAVTFLN